MKRILVVLALFFVMSVPTNVKASSVPNTVSGRIVLSVEEHGEAWYVDPQSDQRFYLKDGEAAFSALRTYGLGITNADLENIPIGIDKRFTSLDSDNDGLFDTLEIGIGTDPYLEDSDNDGFRDDAEVLSGYNPMGEGALTFNPSFAQSLSGRILLQVERNGEAWYVNPVDGKRYYMPSGQAAYDIMRYLGLGITKQDLARIPFVASSELPSSSESLQVTFSDSSYGVQDFSTPNGVFKGHVIRLKRDSFNMITSVAEDGECVADCAALPLDNYISQLDAFAGMNGTYFCPPDYNDCSGKTYSFFPPVYDTNTGLLIRGGYDLSFHNRPMIVQTEDGRLFYFHRDEDFGTSLEDFQNRIGSSAVGVIGSWPSLVENGLVVFNTEPYESSFYNLGRRGGIGWDKEFFYLVNIGGATVADLAEVFHALGVDFAMNLDGGGSSALYYNGEYKMGPGRLLPNAVVFRRK